VNVIAYIDGSQFTESVCLHAAWAAKQLGTGVELVHVLEYDDTDPTLLEDHLVSRNLDEGERRLAHGFDSEHRAPAVEVETRRETLIEAARDIRARGVDRVRTAVEYGTLEEHIRERSATAALVVVGKRGQQSAGQHGRIGDHLERMIRASCRPVLVAPSEAVETTRYLIAYDGGPHSGNVVRFLVEQPLLRDCEGTMLLVGSQPGVQQALNDATSHLRSTGYRIQAETGRGNPDRVIPDIMNTEDIDLLVMGSFGHSRLHALLGMSTTRKLLRSSRKAILVVP
jgi:nucleotide-binding universal stress UspA family protein